MWKGTAETLNASPARMKTMPITRPTDGASSGWAANSAARVSKDVVPANPYTSEQP